MAFKFNPKVWHAREGIGLNMFSIDGKAPVELVCAPTQVTQEGDALSAENLNDLETRISKITDVPVEITNSNSRVLTITGGDASGNFSNSAVYINGGIAISNAASAGSLSVTNVASAGSLSVTNAASAGSLSVANAASIGGVLSITSTEKYAINCSGGIYGTKLYNAVWNDLADTIEVDCEVEPGYCYAFDGLHYTKTDKYMDSHCIGIHSDTYGFAMGEKNAKHVMRVAISGFVLAYVDKEYEVGTPLACTESGKLTEMKREDVALYPERLVGTYWKSEPNKEWGEDGKKIKVNGRKWIKIK